ncbi:MAG TPA: RNA polymerase sigma factor [Opitutaceae bacterium]|nr:RNA polymerase sigma factor [Opitutaceae bacterium]
MKNDLSPNNGASGQEVPAGRLEARYLAFLETIAQVRPSLHRYCARMTGSALDGEDVVQEALFQAYRKLETFDDTRRLEPWLFRIAVVERDFTPPVEPIGAALGTAVEHLVLILPPKERACVLLKDVFDYSLEEIAELVESTVGGVKAALHRGRSKLAAQPISRQPARAPIAVEDAALLRLYVERFNRRDWAGVRELIAADARLLVVDRFAGLLKESPYFGTYDRIAGTWRMAVGEVDGAAVVIIQQPGADGWIARTAVRLSVRDGRIVDVRDYWFCPWLVSAAAALHVDEDNADASS